MWSVRPFNAPRATAPDERVAEAVAAPLDATAGRRPTTLRVELERFCGRLAAAVARTAGVTDWATRPTNPTQRPTINGRTDHISERHSATNWHNDWDRRHTHFFNHRFFVFDDGFWFGLDQGFFPWDYYPYYAYDYYPYDYYPGYYADVEPYYYNEGVYSDTPMKDPTVSAVQTELTQKGYYNGPVDGIYGPTTRDAVAKYQIAKGLDVTGSLSPDTLQSLQLPQPTAS